MTWQRARFGGLFLLLIAALGLAGCAGYSNRIQKPRMMFEVGQYDAAIDELKKLVEANDNDQLLYLMDLGMVYHSAGRYQQAIDVFLKADKLAEIKDYTSLSAEAGSVLLNDDIKPYKGENFEKILINVYLALDYTLLHKWEDALVECRRVNHKLDLMISRGGLPYEHNSFAKYLAAALFEARRETNDAFVDYRTVLKWMGDYPYLGAPLLRTADRLKASQEFAEFRTKFPSVDKYKIAKNEGEIVLILEQGKSPEKVPSQALRLVPVFRKRSYGSDYVWLSVDDKQAARVRTYTLFDIEATAIKELDSRLAGIVAKKIGGVVVKEIVANQVAKQTKSEAAGVLTSLLLHLSDKADLRSWTTLPARLQLARMIVPAGRHDVVLDMVSPFGSERKGIKRWKDLEVKPGETVFINFRTPD